MKDLHQARLAPQSCSGCISDGYTCAVREDCQICVNCSVTERECDAVVQIAPPDRYRCVHQDCGRTYKTLKSLSFHGRKMDDSRVLGHGNVQTTSKQTWRFICALSIEDSEDEVVS